MTETRSYNSIFAQCVLGTTTELESKLGRSLRPEEKTALFSAGSMMMLETLDMAIHYFESKEKLETKLQTFCAMANGRFSEAKGTVKSDVSKHLGRHLVPDEVALLEGARSIHDINLLVERFEKEGGG